jgi:hypothetical protein
MRRIKLPTLYLMVIGLLLAALLLTAIGGVFAPFTPVPTLPTPSANAMQGWSS